MTHSFANVFVQEHLERSSLITVQCLLMYCIHVFAKEEPMAIACWAFYYRILSLYLKLLMEIDATDFQSAIDRTLCHV